VGYPDGRLGLINRAFEQLTGYSGAELRAMDWATTLTPPEWREIERRKLEGLYATGQPVRYEKEYLRKDGTRVPIELLVDMARDAEGKLEYYYSFVTDITARKQAEDAVQQLNADLRQRVGELHAANEELTRFNQVTVGRELRIIELKKQVNELCGKLGQPPRYRQDFDHE
jgi:PAS domain S-box-containing protein